MIHCLWIHMYSKSIKTEKRVYTNFKRNFTTRKREGGEWNCKEVQKDINYNCNNALKKL